MTTPTLGLFTFDIFNGHPQPPADILEEITRPGVAGVTYRIIGYKGEIFQARSIVAVNNLTTATNLNIEYKAAVGTIKTLIDSQNITWNDLLVLECHIEKPTKFNSAIGNINNLTSGYHVQATWTLQMTA